MVRWDSFVPSDFEYDFESDKLSAHGVTFEEAVEVFFSNFVVRKNKGSRERHQLLGRTFSGRPLKIIFLLKQDRVVRIITGWPL